jgi:hypothetical protein
MFCDGNVLYWAKEEWTYGPDAEYYDALDTVRWAGFIAWSDAEFHAAVEARKAYMYTNLDTRPLEQRPDDRAASFRPPIAPCRRWQAVVNAHREQELAKWNERELLQEHAGAAKKQEHAGAASKKQEHAGAASKKQEHAGAASKKQKH